MRATPVLGLALPAGSMPVPVPVPVPVPAGSIATPAGIARAANGEWSITGNWTVRGLGRLTQQLDHQALPAGDVVLEGSHLQAVDSTGAWVLQRWLRRHRAVPQLRNWPPRLQKLVALVGAHVDKPLAAAPHPAMLQRVGKKAVAGWEQAAALMAFIGQAAVVALGLLRHPRRMRWRTVLRNVQIGGFEALPIIGLISLLLGVVVAYQGADQLRHYGPNIFVVDLVGYAMLREFAPLISAIIIAGRSGSAYAAQIGTMVVTEEVDAMRTIAIDPVELLVLPKILALALALPLLTVFADVTGVFGGMLMARSQLGVGMLEFVDRLGQELQGSSLLIGLGKSMVFAVIIALVGFFQVIRTRGNHDRVGRQKTLSVVQSIFLVIVADALFSVVSGMLDL